jgi:hypothetical protein
MNESVTHVSSTHVSCTRGNHRGCPLSYLLSAAYYVLKLGLAVSGLGFGPKPKSDGLLV